MHQELLEQEELHILQMLGLHSGSLPQPGEERKDGGGMIASCIGQVGRISHHEEIVALRRGQELTNTAGLKVLEDCQMREGFFRTKCLHNPIQLLLLGGSGGEEVLSLGPGEELVVADWRSGGVELVVEEMLLQVGENEQVHFVEVGKGFSVGVSLEVALLLGQ